MERVTGWESLYARQLGPQWSRLPSIVREAHGERRCTTATGVVEVRPAERAWAQVLLRLLGVSPRQGRQTAEIRIERSTAGETWVRRFGTRRLRSWQEPGTGGTISEAVGPLMFEFAVAVAAGVLQFRTRSTRLRIGRISIPVPRRIAPVATADVTGSGASWQVDVDVQAPLLGRLLGYSGELWLVDDR